MANTFTELQQDVRSDRRVKKVIKFIGDCKTNNSKGLEGMQSIRDDCFRVREGQLGKLRRREINDDNLKETEGNKLNQTSEY